MVIDKLMTMLQKKKTVFLSFAIIDVAEGGSAILSYFLLFWGRRLYQ